MKNRVKILAGKLRLNTVPERLWQHISVDFITKWPVSRGHDLVLVVYDRFLKILHFIVMTEKITLEGLARLFRDNMWKLYRLLESVVLDMRPQFVAGLMKKLNEMLEIKTKLSTDFHPQIIRQTNKKDKSRARVVFKDVHWSQTKQLVEIVGNSRICL